MKAYSSDLRLRIIQAVDTGQSKAAVARRFAGGLSSVKRYLAQQGADPTHVERRPGPVPRIGPDDLATVRDLVRATPDATLTEHATAWEQAGGKRVSQWTMGRVVRGLKLTRKKKTLRASEQDEDLRETFRLDLALNLDPQDLVSVDESSTTYTMTRPYARAPQGERALGAATTARQRRW